MLVLTTFVPVSRSFSGPPLHEPPHQQHHLAAVRATLWGQGPCTAVPGVPERVGTPAQKLFSTGAGLVVVTDRQWGKGGGGLSGDRVSTSSVQVEKRMMGNDAWMHGWVGMGKRLNSRVNRAILSLNGTPIVCMWISRNTPGAIRNSADGW